jgi:adenine phosphoribosyltransferase
MMLQATLGRYVRKVPDFPVTGVLFHDIAPLLRDHFEESIEALAGLLEQREWDDIEVVAGIESRGFILGAALAQRMHKGFVTVRKAGKLPPPTLNCGYELEYGSGMLEMAAGSGRLLLVDDVLATGGTLRAAADLASFAGYRVSQLLVLIGLHADGEFIWRELCPRCAMRGDAAA